MASKDAKVTTQQVIDTYIRLGRNISATSRELGIERHAVRYHLRKNPTSEYDKPSVGGKVKGTATRKIKKAGVRRYIVSSVQNNTEVPPKLLDNIKALAEHYGAEILLATYTYNKNAYGPMSVKWHTEDHAEELWYDASVLPYIVDERVELAPGLIWYGEANISPTAVSPLRQLKKFGGQNSGLFPHAKQAMSTVPTPKLVATKEIYTTGTLTKMNYIQKFAGFRAEFDHVYGGLIVEVDEDGTWFVRQLNADKSWRIQDFDVIAADGEVTTGNPIEGICWGDIHEYQLELIIKNACWGEGGILDVLRPKYQFFHDLLDFRSRNHHDEFNFHRRFALWVNGGESVARELSNAAEFLRFSTRPWCQSVVVNSNHDRALTKWLQKAKHREDPVNAEIFLELELGVVKAITKSEPFHVLQEALAKYDAPAEAKFLWQDESFMVKGIECGMHGDEGNNGTKATPEGMDQLGVKVNMGDKHSPALIGGVMCVGVTGALDQGYNTGPSSWARAHGLIYPNGKRTLFFMRDTRWRV